MPFLKDTPFAWKNELYPYQSIDPTNAIKDKDLANAVNFILMYGSACGCAGCQGQNFPHQFPHLEDAGQITWKDVMNWWEIKLYRATIRNWEYDRQIRKLQEIVKEKNNQLDLNLDLDDNIKSIRNNVEAYVKKEGDRFEKQVRDRKY